MPKTYVPKKRQRKVHGIDENNKFVVLPEYFEDVLWKDLHAELKKVGALVFVNIYNGEVNHVTVKKVNPGVEEPIKNVETGRDIPPQSSKGSPETPETIPAPGTEEEIPEEGEAELPPEKTSSQNIPTTKEKENGRKVQEQEQKNETQEEGQTLEPGHRVLANYKGKEVRGDVIRIIDDEKEPEVHLRLDSGEKAILKPEDLLSILVSARAK